MENSTTSNGQIDKQNNVGYIITEEEINALLSYLQSKPYSKVYQLIHMLLSKGNTPINNK